MISACSESGDAEPEYCQSDWVVESVAFTNAINQARTQLDNVKRSRDFAEECTTLKNALNSYIVRLTQFQGCSAVNLPAKLQDEINVAQAELDALGDDCD